MGRGGRGRGGGGGGGAPSCCIDMRSRGLVLAPGPSNGSPLSRHQRGAARIAAGCTQPQIPSASDAWCPRPSQQLPNSCCLARKARLQACCIRHAPCVPAAMACVIMASSSSLLSGPGPSDASPLSSPSRRCAHRRGRTQPASPTCLLLAAHASSTAKPSCPARRARLQTCRNGLRHDGIVIVCPWPIHCVAIVIPHHAAALDTRGSHARRSPRPQRHLPALRALPREDPLDRVLGAAAVAHDGRLVVGSLGLRG